MPVNTIVMKLLLFAFILLGINSCTTSMPRHPDYKKRIDNLELVIDDFKEEVNNDSKNCPNDKLP